jgi:ribosomal protein S25
MSNEEKTQLLKELLAETQRLTGSHAREKVPLGKPMSSEEKTHTRSDEIKLVKELLSEMGKLSANRVRDKIPSAEAEEVKTELVCIAKRLVDKCGLSIPDARRVLHELLDVSV